MFDVICEQLFLIIHLFKYIIYLIKILVYHLFYITLMV